MLYMYVYVQRYVWIYAWASVYSAKSQRQHPHALKKKRESFQSMEVESKRPPTWPTTLSVLFSFPNPLVMVIVSMCVGRTRHYFRISSQDIL